MPHPKFRKNITVPNELEVFNIFNETEIDSPNKEESIENFVKYFENKSFKDFFLDMTYYIKKRHECLEEQGPKSIEFSDLDYLNLLRGILKNASSYITKRPSIKKDNKNIFKKIKNIINNTEEIYRDFKEIKGNIINNENFKPENIDAIVPLTKERWLTLNVTGASLLDKMLRPKSCISISKNSKFNRFAFRKLIITALIKNNVIKDFPVFTQENADWSGKVVISQNPNQFPRPQKKQSYINNIQKISLNDNHNLHDYRVPLVSFLTETQRTQTIMNILSQCNRVILEDFYKQMIKNNKENKNLNSKPKESRTNKINELNDISLVLIDHLQILNKDAILGEAFPPYLRPSAQADATDPALEPAQRHTGALIDVAGPSAQPNPLPLVEHINADDWALLSSLIRETPDDDTLTAFEHPPAAQEPAQRHTDALMDVAGPSAQPNPLPLVEHMSADDWALLSSWIQREAADDETLTAFEHPPAAQEPAQRHTGALMDVAGPSAQPNPLPFLEHMSADDWALLSSWIQREAADDETLSAALTPFEHPPAAQEPAQRHTDALMDIARPSAQPNPLPLVEHTNADDWALLSSWIRETPDDDTLTAALTPFEHPPAAQEPAQRHTDALMDIARPSALPNIPQTELIAEGGDNLWASSFPKRKHFQEKASTSQEGGFAKRHTQQQQGRYR